MNSECGLPASDLVEEFGGIVSRGAGPFLGGDALDVPVLVGGRGAGRRVFGIPCLQKKWIFGSQQMARFGS